MASESGTLKFILLGEDRTASKALAGVGDESDKTSGKLGKLGTVIGTAIGVVAASAIFRFASDSVSAFSELEDATEAARVVFGDSMDDIIAQSQDAARTLGMSKAQVIDAANMFGTFGKAAGLAGDDLSGFSVQMTTLAADLSSFKGGTVEEAVQAIGSALRGEMEPIRRYGVLLDDATLRQEALAMGLIKTTKDALTPQQKTLAAQSAILKQTSDATGDFARHQDSTANVGKRMAAEQANLAAALGETLAPSVKTAQQALIGLMQAAQDNIHILPPLITALSSIAVVAGGVLVVTKVADGVSFLRKTMQTAQGAVETFGLKLFLAGKQAESVKLQGLGQSVMGLGKALPVLGIAATAAGAAWMYFAAKAEESRQRVENLTQAIEADAGALGENTKAALVNALGRDDIIAAAERMGLSLRDLTEYTLGNEAAIKKVNDALEESAPLWARQTAGAGDRGSDYQIITDALGEQSKAMGEATSKAQVYADAMQATGEASTDAAPNVEELAKASGEVAKKASDAARELDKQRDAIWGVSDAAIAASGDEIGYQKSIMSTTEAIKEHAKALKANQDELDLTTKAGQELQSALDAQAKSALATMRAQIDLGGSADELVPKMAKMREDFVQAAQKAGLSESAAKRMADQYGLVPGNVRTDIELRGDQTAKERTAALIGRLNEIPASKRSEILALLDKGAVDEAERRLNQIARPRSVSFVPRNSSTPQRSAYASGGRYQPGEFALVGEEGPELLWMPNRPGEVINASRTRELMRGAGSPGVAALGADGTVEIGDSSVARLGAAVGREVLAGAGLVSRRAVEVDNRNRQAAGRPL